MGEIVGIYSEKSMDIDVHILAHWINDIIAEHGDEVIFRSTSDLETGSDALVAIIGEVSDEEIEAYHLSNL